MPEFKKDKSGFRMKGFSPFNMGNAYKTPMQKPLVGNQDRLPEELKEKILDSPMKMYDKSAMKKYGKSPMKKDDKTDERVFNVNQEKYDKWNRMMNRGKGPDVRYLGAKENKKSLDAYLRWKKSGATLDDSPMKKHGDPPVKPPKNKAPKLQRKSSKKEKGTGFKYDVPKGDMKKMDKEFYSFKPKQHLKDEPAKPSSDYFNPEYWGNFDEVD